MRKTVAARRIAARRVAVAVAVAAAAVNTVESPGNAVQNT